MEAELASKMIVTYPWDGLTTLAKRNKRSEYKHLLPKNECLFVICHQLENHFFLSVTVKEYLLLTAMLLVNSTGTQYFVVTSEA
jgi:hypothetical protein